MRYLLLIGVLLGGFLLVGYYLLSEWEETPSTSTGAATTTGETSEAPETIPEQWSTFTAPVGVASGTFTFQHPPQATVTAIDTNIYEVTYVGPRSEPHTELTDGYYTSLRFVRGTPLREYVAANDPLDTPTVDRQGSYDARTYTTESALGTQPEHRTLVLRTTPPLLLDITQTISGTASATAAYTDEVERIVRSLSFDIDLEKTPTAEESADSTSSPITIATPQPSATVASPVTIRGEAQGTWFFEGDAPVSIVDWDGRIIGEGYVRADGRWMTENFVPFSGEVAYELATNTPYTRGQIIMRKANPSGLPENDDAIEVPVTLVPN